MAQACPPDARAACLARAQGPARLALSSLANSYRACAIQSVQERVRRLLPVRAPADQKSRVALQASSGRTYSEIAHEYNREQETLE